MVLDTEHAPESRNDETFGFEQGDNNELLCMYLIVPHGRMIKVTTTTCFGHLVVHVFAYTSMTKC